MKSRTSRTRRGRTSTPVSSRVSRTTAASTVSPVSKAPPGRLHRSRRTYLPHATRHDISRMSLPQDDRCGLPPLPGQGLAHREARGVVTPTDARVRRPALESLVIPEHHDVAAQRIPQRIRIPRFDQLVSPWTWDHHDEESVVEDDRHVHPDVGDVRERLDRV